MSELARLEVDGLVARLAINRPEQRNALSIDLLDALHARLGELERAFAERPDAGPRVLVLRGEGRAFCAGMDLKQVLVAEEHGGSGDRSLPLQLLEGFARLTVRLRRLPCVVIAHVNGPAIGGGCGLSCVCDLSVTHAENKVGFPEVDLGLCPAVVAPWVVRKLGAGRARAVLLRGGIMTGRAAHALGMFDLLGETPEEAAALVEELADRVKEDGPRALAATKGLLNDLDGSTDEDLVLRGAKLSAEVLLTDEAQRRLAASRR